MLICVYLNTKKTTSTHKTTAASSTEQTKSFYANDGEASGTQTGEERQQIV